MSVYLMTVSQSGKDSAILSFVIDRTQTWSVTPKPSWLRDGSGRWTRRRNATKFRQFSFIELSDSNGKTLAHLPEIPFPKDGFRGELFSAGFFATSEGYFDVGVLTEPEPSKYRIRELGGPAVGVAMIQVEWIGFEIQSVTDGSSRKYRYRAAGISLSPTPAKLKLPTAMPGVDTPGPWNNFSAPAWLGIDDFGGDAVLETHYNVGLGTSISSNIFSFAPVENGTGYWVDKLPLNTGRTIALPSMGAVKGSMTVVKEQAPKSGGKFH